MKKKIDFRQTPDLAKLEEEILQFWDKDHTFEKSVEQRPADNAFSFYDGPPFATGMPHYGHLLQSYIKDLIPRYQTMKGKRVRRVWGWDCHGLPIENIVEKELSLKSKKEIEDYGVAEFNEACRTKVLTYADEWKKTIHRIARWIDMDHAYKTMDMDYMESVWWVFKTLWDKGLIYKSHKSMHICPRCVTPLSNFEVTQGYKTVKDISVTVQFKVKDASQLGFQPEQKVEILAWTTTPWTLPGNLLLVVNEDIDYSVLSLSGSDSYVVLASDRVTAVMADKEYQLVKKVKGKELVGLSYEPIFPYFANWHEAAFKVVAADFVSLEEGTGIVHAAPAFGDDDFKLGKKMGLPLLQHVSMDGSFIKEVSDFAGLQVKPKDDPQSTDILIIKHLAAKGNLFAKQKVEHSYPHCWRCDTPLLNYATDSWFVKVTDFKDQLLNNNQNINWQPEHVKEGRFGKWLANARDWAISRNRFWGTPLPVWQSEDGDFICVGSVAELEKLTGQKVTDLHKHLVDKLEFDLNGKHYRRISEVLDCWFESGSMPYGQLHYPFANQEEFERSFPADFISEGQDQTRGWFYTLHVLATALTLDQEKKTSAFDNVMCTGLIMAEDGKKMSKRLKNYPEPELIINQYGSDSLRLYLMSSPAVKAETLNFVEADVANIRRRVFLIWWNVLAFYKSFAKQDLKAFNLTKEAKHPLDRWILSRLESLNQQMQAYLEQFDVMKASRLVAPFIDELSTWYLRLSRDRLKAEDNQEVSQVFARVLHESARIFAPITPFFSELVIQQLVDDEQSVHLMDYPNLNTDGIDLELEADMKLVQKVVELGHGLRKEKQVKARQPLAKLSVFASEKLKNNELLGLLKSELNVKEVVWLEGEDLTVDYDFVLTEELKAEGEARAIIRQIQGWRKEAGLAMTEEAEVVLKSWPKQFQPEIEQKTKSKLTAGEKEGLK